MSGGGVVGGKTVGGIPAVGATGFALGWIGCPLGTAAPPLMFIKLDSKSTGTVIDHPYV